MTPPRADQRGWHHRRGRGFLRGTVAPNFPIFRHQRKFRGAGINRRVGRSHHQKPLKIDMAARSRPGATITSRGE
jgi:hypothetical protein